MLEYNEIKCEDKRIKTYTYKDQFESKFDVVISYSSFEHSGLGRYGDELYRCRFISYGSC
jgi:cyclopropane fatty-acyl-phospholipid synthase-like methyltransferase